MAELQEAIDEARACQTECAQAGLDASWAADCQRTADERVIEIALEVERQRDALLAACEAFMACFVRPTPGGSAHAFKLGEAAIALARGEKETT